MVDVESDGPIPGDYSMIAVGAVVVEPDLSRTFRAYLRPISEKWDPEAIAVGGFTREQTMGEAPPYLNFAPPQRVMEEFAEWIRGIGVKRPIFIADNNGFDWSFVNWYFHHFTGSNPFGFSSQNLNSFYKGLTRDSFASFRHLRRTKHDHDPLNDAKGNAEALLHMAQEMGMRIPL